MASEEGDTDASPPSVGKMASAQRAFELRRVFAPELLQNREMEAQFNKEFNADGALDAFAETVIWRLDAAHVMISLVDRGVQYFLAGARRNRANDASGDDHDHDNDEDDEEEDDVVTQRKWFGCSTVDIPGGLCENTLALDSSVDQYPTFEVQDLSTDSRFKDLPVVDGTVASYKFYAGTPITTDHGTNIGSLFIFDTKPRKGLTRKQKIFLHSQSSNVMRHLMTKREATEKRRAALMSEGIAKFLDMTAEYRLQDDETEVPEEMRPEAAEPLPEHTGVQDATLTESPAIKDFPAQSTVLEKIRKTLDQAAEILRESLEITKGGVVFLDTTLANTEVSKLVSKRKAHNKLPSYPRQTSFHKGGDPGVNPPDPHGYYGKNSLNKKKTTPKILAASIPKAAAWDAEASGLNPQTLANLIAFHNKGNVWSIDEEGTFLSFREIDEWEKEGIDTPEERRQSLTPEQLARSKFEAQVLAEIFPKARQIVFLPLWDAGSNRWYSGTFIWSQSSTPVFTVNSELTYLSSFTNSMIVEISRLDAVTANKMKSDFLGSISHEFRSPLHGILVSAEFLRDSKLDNAQSELVGTIQNCSGTLLDTINHVLDYTKINSFEIAGTQEEPPTSQLYQVTNLALLCETVTEGLIAANIFRETSLEDTAHSVVSEGASPTDRRDRQHNSSSLQIILDIEDRDWNFKVEAGALQRIIMNLAGNAQKFTSKGHIIISMSIQEQQGSNPDEGPKSTLLLRIKDTGKGISPEFMERKLYSPFAQEDSFVPGVGLGLSIVWSIVNQLGGTIEVQSELGKGTDVRVSLEVLPVFHSWDGERKITETVLPDAEILLAKVRARAVGKVINIVKRTSPTSSQQLGLTWKIMERYLSGWFGFNIEPQSSPDIVVTNDEKDCQEHPHQKTLLIEEDSSRPLRRKAEGLTIMNHPFGPFKLARALLGLLDQDLSPMEQEGVAEHQHLKVEAATQTPLGSPAERKVLNGIILTDYDFPSTLSKSLSDNEAQSAAQSTGKENDPGLTAPPPTTNIALRLPDRTRLSQSRILSTPVSSSTSADAFMIGDFPPSIVPQAVPLPSSPTSSPPLAPTVLKTVPRASSKIPKMKTAPATDHHKRSLRILAVDDNALNLQLLHRYLQKRKQDVIETATDGVEAVKKVKGSTQFDIVFMDISMPNMDGFEATRLIRSFERAQLHRSSSDLLDSSHVRTPSPSNAPLALANDAGENLLPAGVPEGVRIRRAGDGKAFIVALTGLASRRDRDEAQQSGFDDFLTKPISFKRIGELLDRLSWEK